MDEVESGLFYCASCDEEYGYSVILEGNNCCPICNKEVEEL